MDFENHIKCGRCGQRHPIENMVLDKYAENMLCPTCASDKGLASKDGGKGSLSFSSDFSNATRVQRAVEKGASSLINYKCLACGYEFKRRADFEFSGRCPYCGKNEVGKDPIKSGHWVDLM